MDADGRSRAPGIAQVAGASAPERRQTVLLVDDEPDILDSLAALLEMSIEGVTVRTAPSGQAALAVLEHEPVDLVISDYKMPGMNGLELLERAKAVAPKVPRILVTAFPDLQVAIRAINDAGIENFFTKPFDTGKVIEVVRNVLRARREEEMRERAFARSLDVLRRRLDEE